MTSSDVHGHHQIVEPVHRLQEPVESSQGQLVKTQITEFRGNWGVVEAAPIWDEICRNEIV